MIELQNIEKAEPWMIYIIMVMFGLFVIGILLLMWVMWMSFQMDLQAIEILMEASFNGSK